LAADLCVTYDWPDEMVGGPYTPDVLRHEFAFLRDHGVSRVYWLDYPSRHQHGDYIGSKTVAHRADNHRRTHEAFGGDVMPAACTLAHDLGLHFLTICKPYDLNDFVSIHRDRPDLWFQRNPAWMQPWQPSDTPFDVALYADNDAPLAFDPGSIAVWTSDDNNAYRRLDGIDVSTDAVERPRYRLTPAGKTAVEDTEHVSRITLRGLSSSARYFAVHFPDAAEPGVFGNQEFLLAETALPVELARFPRAGGFREHGFAFETDTHAAVWSHQSEFVAKRRHFPSGSAIGLRLGHDPGMPQMLDPGHAEVRDFWLKLWIDRAIAAGCDGVDVRIAHHHLCTDWPAFAYADPVLAAFRDRFGREPEPSADDTLAIQGIRGEFHTAFLREAGQRLHAAGKLLEAHVEARMRVPSDVTAYTGIRWDWTRWIEEGLIDGINLKYLGPANPVVQEELLPRARKAGIPIRCISAVGDPRSQPRTPDWAVEQLRLCRLCGIDALNLYETWVYLRTTPRGEWFPRGCARAVFAALKEELQTP
jgi:hypothetical protein